MLNWKYNLTGVVDVAGVIVHQNKVRQSDWKPPEGQQPFCQMVMANWK